MAANDRWNLGHWVEYALARLMQRLPVSWVSAIGAFLGARAARKAIRAKRLWIARLHDNFSHYLGELDERARERRIVRAIARVGRVYAETMVLDKIVAQGRLRVEGEEPRCGEPQMIIVSSHLANWELVCGVATGFGRPYCCLYMPPKNPVYLKLVMEARRRWSDLNEFVPGDAVALRKLNNAIARGLNVLIFIDEEKDGCIAAPSLGRDLAYAGNRWYAARLAVRYGLPVLPVHVERVGNARYRVVMDTLMAVPAGGDDESRARQLADMMDERLEPHVRSALEDWYWLPYFERKKVLAGR